MGTRCLTVCIMFKRRDIPPVLILLFLIILVMITLSQILIVHQHGRQTKSARQVKTIQQELKQMDQHIESAMKGTVPNIELHTRLLQAEIYRERIASIIQTVAEKSFTFENHTKKNYEKLSKNTKTIYAAPERRSSNSNRYDSTRRFIDSKEFDYLQKTRDIQGIDFMPQNESLTNGSGPRINVLNDLSSEANNVNVTKTNLLTVDHKLEYCKTPPPSLRGNVFVDVQHTHDIHLRDVIEANSDVQVGGHWKPRDCVARHRLAVIIPYRDRKKHLTVLLAHILPILKRQMLNFRIYVVEQYGNETFNKGRIMNSAFKEALKQYDFQCFVFHDVDLIPEDDRNMYSCPVLPRHLSVAIDEMDYRLTYDLLVGGVLNFRTEHFQKVNGYSNMYWGWGAEDDDMAYRILNVGLKISRPPPTLARYKMIRHTKRTPTDWKKRAILLKTVARRFRFDGLNSLHYKLVTIKNERLFTYILVDIGKPP